MSVQRGTSLVGVDPVLPGGGSIPCGGSIPGGGSIPCEPLPEQRYSWDAVAQWLDLERVTVDREVVCSDPAGAASKIGQVRLPHIACVFRRRH